MPSIDEVFVQIDSDASNASSGLDKLSISLKNIKSSVSSSTTKNINSLKNSLSELSKFSSSLKIDTTGLKSLSQALAGFKGLGNISSSLSGLKELPSITQSIDDSALTSFASKVDRLNESLGPLAKNLAVITANMNLMPSAITKANTALEKNKTKANESATANDKLSSKLGALLSGFSLVGIFYGLQAVGSVMSGFINKSTGYIETLNLFKVSFGELADEAENFVNEFSSVLGVDPTTVMQSMGDFNSLARSFGVASDEALIMSQNLTQLAYDMSSFRNISIEDSLAKIRSGFVGEIEPMRAVGVALDEATLQQTAYSLGIDETISNMNRLQKTQLLYYQMLESTTYMQGDMARTLLQPANAIRILQEQFSLLGRAIGNIFLPIIMQVIPYVMVLTQILTELAQAIANFFGFELPDMDYATDAFGDVSSGLSSVEDSASSANDEVKKMLANFDELNVIDFGDTDTGSGAGSDVSAGGALDIPLLEYDALEGALTRNLDEVKKKLEDILPIVGIIAAGLASWGTLSSLVKFADTLGILDSLGLTLKGTMGGLFTKVTGITAAIAGLVIMFQGLQKIWEGDVWQGLSKALIGLGIAVAGVAVAFGGMAALIVAAIGSIVVVQVLVAKWIKDNWGFIADKFNELKELFNVDFSDGFQLSDIGGIILAALGTWFETIKKFWGDVFGSIWEFISPVMQPLIDGISTFFSGVWDAVSQFFSGVFETISQPFVDAWNYIVGIWDKVADWFNKTVIEPVASVFVPLITKVGEIFAKIWEIISVLWGIVADWFNDNVIQPIINGFNYFKDVIVTIFQTTWNFIVGIWTTVNSWFYNYVIQPLINIFNSVKDGIVWAFQTAWNFVVGIWSSITGFFISVGQAIANTISGAVKGAINGVLSWVERTVNSFITGINRVVGIINEIPGVEIGYVSKLVLPRFEDGGFPNMGQMFIAREAGPELVGTIGNKSAVANNSQIIEGVSAGVYEAVISAMSSSNNKQPIVVNVGNKQLYSGYGQYLDSENNMYGSTAINV